MQQLHGRVLVGHLALPRFVQGVALAIDLLLHDAQEVLHDFLVESHNLLHSTIELGVVNFEVELFVFAVLLVGGLKSLDDGLELANDDAELVRSGTVELVANLEHLFVDLIERVEFVLVLVVSLIAISLVEVKDGVVENVKGNIRAA